MPSNPPRRPQEPSDSPQASPPLESLYKLSQDDLGALQRKLTRVRRWEASGAPYTPADLARYADVPLQDAQALDNPEMEAEDG